MSSGYSIFCVILSIIVLGLGLENYEIWSPSAGMVIKREVPKKPGGKPEAVPALAPKEAPPREGYKVVAEKNIFNPERKEFPVVAGDDVSKRPNVRPQVTLYGVVVSVDYQTATVVNPGRPLQKGEREARTVKVGEKIGDYKVAQIMEDRIVMENAGDTFEVLLYDPGAPKRRMEVKTAVPPAAVTSSIGGPAASPKPGAVPGPTPSMAGPSSTARPAPMSPSPGPGLAPSGPQPMQPAVTPTPSQPSPGAAMQPSGVQPPTSTTTPSPGIWRGRRPVQPGTQTGTQGN